MKFTSFNLKPEMIEALEKIGYVNATPVQDVVIPKALKNENIVVQSETGTGKTHSFIIPIINNLVFDKKIQAIIICPTRELARQTYDFIMEFIPFFTDLSCKLFISGIDQTRDEQSLKNGCEIIVATPGRLNYLKDYFSNAFSNVKTIVLDEADMLMDKEFSVVINEIINSTKKSQIEVFSATISKSVEQFLKKYISADYVLTLNEKHATSETVSHYLINTKHSDIKESVKKFIDIKHPYLLMIFSNSQEKTRTLYNYLSSQKYKVAILSGELQARERKSMLRRIKNDEFSIICCTDMASRGLDISNVSDVLSTEIPNNTEYYFHRAGRSGRNFKNGNSYIFYDQDHLGNVNKLIELGIKFEYLKFFEDSLIDDVPFDRSRIRRKKKVNTELKKDVKMAVERVRTKNVKPGYKKKMKAAAEKVKKQYKREIIKKDIRRQMTERYKKNKKID